MKVCIVLFIVHARKAWLKGLSPKQNREIPPLEYETVVQLKKDFPELTIVINGGIEAYSNPYMLSEVDRLLFDDTRPISERDEVIEQYTHYCRKQLENGARLNHMARHILGLYSGQRGARLFRRHLSENT